MVISINKFRTFVTRASFSLPRTLRSCDISSVTSLHNHNNKLNNNTITFGKMAAEGAEFTDEVVEFLDKEFGEDLDRLKEVEKIIKEREDLSNSLRLKISKCSNETDVTKEKAQLAGKEQLEEIDRLLEEKEIEETKVKEYSSKNEELVEKIGNINQEIEQINCLQVYLSWVAQISHLSSEMKKELTAGNLEIATEFFYNLTEITGRLKDSSCQNLVDYAVTSQEYWFKALSDLLVRELDETLIKMKWPFATGTSSPQIADNKDDVMSKFCAITKLILKLDSQKINYEKTGKTDALILTKILVKPFQKRFAFHFYGSRRTNNLEKPEWYFTQILNWIRDHSSFLESFVQPIIDDAGYLNHYVQHEFIQALLETCMEKIKTTLPQVITNESLFSHLIDETILFDNELRSLFDYPSQLPGCTSVLLQKPYLDHWIDLETKCAIDAVNNILLGNEAFTSKYGDPDVENNLKVPACVEDFIEQLSLITEKYKSFGNTEAQLRFLDLQLMLLEYFIKKLEEIGDIESSSLNYKAIYSLLNGSQFIVDILTDWTEQVFFIQLFCIRSQKSDKMLSKSTRLDDSLAEEQVSFGSMDAVSDQQDSLLERGLFDDVISSLEDFIKSLTTSLLRNSEKDLKSKLKPYREERWHCCPPPKDLVTQMLSSSACSVLMNVKETLQSMNDELCSSIFGKVWQKYAQIVDRLIFEEVILESHFNEGGASQIKFDLTKNLFLIFEEHTAKPDSFFKMTKDACTLLNLLSGSGVLLQEALMLSEKNKTEDKENCAKNALLDVGVKNTSVNPT
ncbi:RAD50-interacting protein 1-like [Rhopilema esculentum]|uniref:RAD50-interacting protein 1-like n=1 Tax=Rhopilema esculentum TaxID=499914 RepID=UPI0031D06FD3